MSEKLNKTIEYLLYALLAFSPFAFGGVHAVSEQVVITLSGLMLICLLVRMFIDGGGFTWTWAYVPAAVFVFIAAFQLIELPASVVGLLSPNTVAEKTDLLTTLPEHVRPAMDSMSLSFYSNVSKHDLRIIFAVVSVFVVVVNTFRSRERIIRLLTAITLIGAAVALLALAQVVTLSHSIYWIFDVSKLADSGPFVNHSHYAQYMNMCIGAALGLLFVKLHSSFTGRRVTPSVALDHCLSEESRLQWFLVGFIIIAAATVFVSLSRGGMLSMPIAAAFTTLVVSSRHSIKGRGWIMTVMALGAFICVLYIGFDAVYDRFSTLHDSGQYEDRWTMFTSIAAEFKKFPLLGTGIGTYSVIYPMFDNTMTTSLATHAENEYAQAIAETGFVGFGVLCVFGFIVWSAFAKNIRSAKLPIRSAAYGLGFGLLAILIHSLSDFGQHLPANAILTATFCGLLISLTKIEKPEAQQPGTSNILIPNPQHLKPESLIPNPLSLTPKKTAVLSLLAVSSAVFFWSFTTANSSRISQRYFDKCLDLESSLADRNWQAGNLDYIELISNAQKAAEHSPGNVKYRHWLNVYRWRSISRNIDAETGALILPPEGQQWVRRLADEFYGAIVQCPTYGPSWCMAGQLESVVLGNAETGTALIEQGYKLAPSDPAVCLTAGHQQALNYLDSVKSSPANADSKNLTLNHLTLNTDSQSESNASANLKLKTYDLKLKTEAELASATKKLERAVMLDARLFPEVVDIYIDQLNRPDLALELAGESIHRLSRVANKLADLNSDSELAASTRSYISELLEKRALQPDAPAGALASLANTYRRDELNDKAIEFYKRALARDYGNIHWRYALASLLAAEQRNKEAIHQCRIVLRLNPNHRQAKELIADLSVEPAP